MSSNLNLFLLHRPSDRHPRSWICVQGKVLIDVVQELERDILKAHKLSREHLSKLVSDELHCARGVVKNILRGGASFYPLVVLKKLIVRSTRPKAFYKRIRENILTLKVNSASAKPVNAVHVLSKDLAKIIGAFAADGSLSVQLILATTTQSPMEKLCADLGRTTYPLRIRWSQARKQYYVAIQLNEHSRGLLEYLYRHTHKDLLTQTHWAIELVDEYEDSVRAFAKWMKAVFNIEPTSLNIKKEKRAWRVIFSNKIVARYLTEFFGMKSGLKTYTVSEPEVIQNSTLEVRRSFARGALMFDGCVTKGGKISFSSKSKNFASAIQDIWAKDKINQGILLRNRRGEYVISTIIPNRINRLLKYFEPETQKWKLLRWISGDKKVKPIIRDNGVLSAERILLLLKRIKYCDVNFLERYYKKRYTSIRHYLKILKNHGKVNISTRPHGWSKYIDEKATVYLDKTTHRMLFAKIKEKLNLGKNAADVLGVHKATFSAWKLQNNRIPIEVLRRLCYLVNLDFKSVSPHIVQTNRDVIEFI